MTRGQTDTLVCLDQLHEVEVELAVEATSELAMAKRRNTIGSTLSDEEDVVQREELSF